MKDRGNQMTSISNITANGNDNTKETTTIHLSDLESFAELAKAQQRNHLVKAYVSQAVYDELTVAADQSNRTLEQVIRVALGLYLVSLKSRQEQEAAQAVLSLIWQEPTNAFPASTLTTNDDSDPWN